MGAALPPDVTGAKGGSKKPKAPYEAPDSLRSTNIAKILLAVGEGEFDGTPTARDIYLDNTPIQDASGNMNFPGVKWEFRRGTVEQSYIKGIPAIESETSVGVELRSEQPWTRALSNTQLSAIRLRFNWPRLLSQDTSSGDTNGYTIEYAIDIATDGGAFVQAHRNSVSGKTSNGYQRSVRVDLPAATTGWVVRVRRLTPNRNAGNIADTMMIEAYTEIIDQKLRYPNTALLYIEFDAEQFQNIPSVTVKCKARRWPVPTNYDPIARTYTGTWDGTFKQAWTNNPAFVTYGLCVEDRFGLGKRIKSWMVDKWEMYRIAQYCDQRVPNGVGGQEPRFLCDLNLQGKAEAWTLLRDLSAIYRGMVYWAQGALFMQADMPRAQDFDYVFTRANVIDGEFTYGGAERSTHYSRALVSYDNPGNNYDTDVIPVTDLALQRRYQDRPIEISAIGCTRASEAQRRGKWALLSNNQDRTVTFKTGMEGRIPLPGHVIPVADELLSGRPNGGRIASAAGSVVTLDRDTHIKAGDRLIINLPNGSAQGRTVRSVAGRTVTVTTAYSVQPEPQLQWAIDADDLAIQLFRVLKTARTAEGEYEITGLEFNPSKFAAIDTGAKLEERPISVIPVTTVPPPASVTLTSDYAISQGLAVSTMTISWPAVEGAVGYDVEWRKDSGNWIRLQRTGTASVDVVGIYAGQYLARVRAVSAFDISSIWRDSMLTDLKGKEGLPPAVSYLNASSELFAIGLKWGFPPGAEDTQRTEIWYSPSNDLSVATKLTDLAYPQRDFMLQGLAAGVSFFFWARLVDRTGNIGPWYPVDNGVLGQSGMDASPILDLIAGQIGETELGQKLKDQIDKIPGLQDQIDALDGLKAYYPEQTYTQGEMVVVAGRIYQAAHDVPADPEGGNAPPNVAFWLDVGQSLESANGLAMQVQMNTADITELDGVVTAQASSLQALRAAWREDDGEGDLTDAMNAYDANAAFAQEVIVRATADEAMAQRATELAATVGDVSAGISELERTVATSTEATAEAITQIRAEVGDSKSEIQTVARAQADTDGKLSTMWSVKMQQMSNGQLVAAGFGLSIENDNNGSPISQFIVNANRFAVIGTLDNGQLFTPFVVQSGQVFMNQAFIQDGTITNAKIGSFISSTNYVAGVQGWRLNKDGTLEINGVVAGQGRLTITHRAVKVFDGNNRLRVQLGDLTA
ncbi:phage tail protein [Pseudomonas qingdaonensis]|uniref:phage tail protein n=1 Tax=Pseudomonas qingdaonensis TaxID=2056231 RepID=UPI00265D82ED|nr:phage tail protein [Pseudomonas qingdaonensis]WKL69438.1 phage tail protein [Pseudomonas qingdaonensis]